MRVRLALPLVALLATAAEAGPDLAKLGGRCTGGDRKACDELVKTAKTHKENAVRLAAVERLTDQASLARVACEGYPNQVSEAALVKVTEQSRLADIVDAPSASVVVKEKALDRLEDQAALAKIAQTSIHREFRLKAIAKLSDQAVLATVASNPQASPGMSSLELRIAAIARLTDQTALAALARGDDEYYALKAVERLTEAPVLEELALHAKSRKLQLAAVKQITDQPTLARVGRSATSDALGDYSFAEALVRQVTDQAVLGDLAAKGYSDWLRRLARQALTDERARADFLKNADKLDGGIARIEVRKVKDPALLAMLATEATNYFVRLEAVPRVRDAAALERVLGRSGEKEDVRAAARRRLRSVRANVTVTGTLVEPTLGAPVPNFWLDLGGSDAVTDEQGRFTFTAVNPGSVGLGHEGVQLKRGSDWVVFTAPPSGRLDVGTVTARSDDALTVAFASICASQGPAARVPAGALLVFRSAVRHNPSADAPEWKHDYELVDRIKWSPPWKAALCIGESSSEVGNYVNQAGAKVGTAYSVIWKARAVRLSDGQSFEKTVSAAPPQQAHGSGFGPTVRAGDPSGALLEWLRGLH